MSRRLITLLLPGLITHVVAQNVDKEPDTVCVAYLSTYLVPISSNATGSVPADGVDSSSQIFDAALTASTTFESGIGPSFNLNASGSNPTTAPTDPGSNDQLIVLRIVPDNDNSRRLRLKRALGGFVGSTSEICQDASAFSLSGGRLLDGGRPIYYNGEDFKELRGQQATLPAGAVATTFVGDGGFLRFRSPDLLNGEAGFCQSPGTGQVYITFTSSPPGCVSVRLSVVGVDECEDGQTSASAAIPSTDSQILQPTMDSVVTSVLLLQPFVLFLMIPPKSRRS